MEKEVNQRKAGKRMVIEILLLAVIIVLTSALVEAREDIEELTERNEEIVDTIKTHGSIIFQLAGKDEEIWNTNA